ncbi:predicted unusual protein kinase [Moesziomyces antarcticus T-34]|uniref:Predicted unusual protein kinase n=1 Tax=Pseudozyma antarctica (strain T-34) TaxID=1151754 RepID=M9LSW2_PSEA3|nr:predicted unusual protein kinase [Moesziomyces antarcticus T-34]
MLGLHATTARSVASAALRRPQSSANCWFSSRSLHLCTKTVASRSGQSSHWQNIKPFSTLGPLADSRRPTSPGASSSPPDASDPGKSADNRPFRKQYPPVRPQPKPINFDQPAIPNPKETAAAHAQFRRNSRRVGVALLALILVGAVGYQLQDTIHLDGSQPPIRGLQLPHDEMERQVREAQKSQANSTNFALLALTRSTTIAKAVALCVWDYRSTLNKTYSSREEETEELRQCHLRSAHRILAALQTNGGLYVKLGQHLSAIVLLPPEWTTTLRPLQDQNTPTPLPELEAMFRTETGMSFNEAFSEIDPKPIGVASLAQVHRAVDRQTGQQLALKMMHPDVERFSEVDMKTVTVLVKWVKRLLPDFSFEWLADEMNENMPLEMDFRHEAQNAKRAEDDFAAYRTTSVYIPKVKYVFKRVMAMEFIDGRRPDNLRYLAEHDIDRNRVSQELSRVFSQMLYLHGFFHADPHGGNVLIRPAPPGSRSRYNFEVVLLDHGLYFDIDPKLRANYARFWLSLLKRASPEVTAERRKYAKLIANIDDDLYPILESAITGRAGLEGSDPKNPLGVKDRNRAGSLLDMDGGSNLSDDEQEHIRKTVMEKEGLFLSILDLLRRLPRRMLMVLKLNDLTRSLDASLHTTHGPTRPFLIAARLCALAVYRDDLKQLKERRASGRASLLTSLSLWKDYFRAWWSFVYFYRGLALVEMASDIRARWKKIVQFGANRVGKEGSAEKAKSAAAGLHDQAARDMKDDEDRRRAKLALQDEPAR